MRAVSKASLGFVLVATAALALAACAPKQSRTVSTTAQPSATSSSGSSVATQGKVLPAGQPVKVAVLLPLSGRLPEIGQQLMNASQLALFDLPQNSLELLIKDSGDTPEMAAQAMQQALNEGAQLALGPLFGNQVRAAANVARGGNVNLVAFSNDVRQLDGYSFLMGLTPTAQAERVVSYAVQQGFGQVAVLAPDTDFGRQAAQGAQSGASSAGGQVVSTVFYPAQELDIINQIRALTGPYQALFLPDSHGRMLILGSTLASEGITPETTKLLGSTLWNNGALTNDPNLRGAWFPAMNPQTYNNFVARYQEAYGATPQPIAAVAFDAVTLAGYLARQALSGQVNAATTTPGQWVGLDRNSILNPSGFRGADGIFRFQQNGAVQRGLAIMQIDSGTFTMIAPAPNSFQTLTN
ncbi:MAG: penicillin-binding protein activator [Kiloniellales bacterium]